jgi:hypothetical protein
VGGSQFTMTLWMGYSQTPEIENGNDFPGYTPAWCNPKRKHLYNLVSQECVTG